MVVYSSPATVGVVVDDGRDDRLGAVERHGVVVYLAPLPEGPVRILNGVASLIWLEATATDGTEDLIERVAALVDQPPGSIRTDVESFLATLVENGLLELVEDPDRLDR